MIGHPDETIQDIHETIRFAKKLNPDYVQFSVTTPYPATELYKEAIGKGIIPSDVWKAFAENPNPDFIPPRWEQNIDKQTLYEMLHYCYKKFYLNHKFIMKNLFRIKSITEFKKLAKAGTNIFFHEIFVRSGNYKDGFR